LREQLTRRAFVAAILVCAALIGGCRSQEPPTIAIPSVQEVVPTPEPTPEPAPEPTPGLEISTITFAGQRFTVCFVDLTKHDLDLFWRDDAGEPFRGFEALDRRLQTQGRTLVFAMNAGMYLEDFSPVGLYVEDGEQLRPLNLARGSSNFCLRPNGVFAITDSGAKVVESSTYPSIEDETLLATQSGPMLVIEGELHPAFGPNSTSRLYRDGVGVISPDRVVFAISEQPVNFHEFALLFRDHLECENALFLDGNISSLYSVAMDRCDNRAGLGPILAVTAEK